MSRHAAEPAPPTAGLMSRPALDAPAVPIAVVGLLILAIVVWWRRS